MDLTAGLLSQGEISGHRYRFCGCRDAGQAQPGCHRTFVDTAVVVQMPVLGTHQHQHAKGGGVLQGAPFHQRIGQRPVSVTEGHTAAIPQADHLAQLTALQTLAQSAYR